MKLLQRRTPLTIFHVPLMKVQLAISSPWTMVQCTRAAFLGSIQGSQPRGLGLITLFLLAEHWYLHSKKEHSVPSLRTWFVRAFNRETVVKDEIIEKQMQPEGLVLENINNSDLGRTTYKTSWVFLFQSLAVYYSAPTGSKTPTQKETISDL